MRYNQLLALLRVGPPVACGPPAPLITKLYWAKYIPQATEQHRDIVEFVKSTAAENAPIIPISAQLKYNIEVLSEYIVKKIPIPLRDFTSDPRLVCFLSRFNYPLLLPVLLQFCNLTIFWWITSFWFFDLFSILVF